MSDQIRKQEVGTYIGDPFLQPKENLGGGTTEPLESQQLVTAEWGNKLSDWFMEINEAFNGLDVNALGVNGRVWGSRTGSTLAGTSDPATRRTDILLVKDLVDGEFVHVRAIVYGFNAAENRILIKHCDALFQVSGGTVSRISWLCCFFGRRHNMGGAKVKLFGSATENKIFAEVTGPWSPGSDINWIADVFVRSVPGGLPMPGALE